MTILCLVCDKRDGSWAAFADSLITSDADDEGPALLTPIRQGYDSKMTFGFSEVALEEKIGFVEDQLLLGWANKRAEAVLTLEEIRSRRSDDELNDIISGKENTYFVARYQKEQGNKLVFAGPNDQVHRVEAGHFEFIFAGSGGRIIQGLSFTARHIPLANGAKDAGWAAITALSRFLSEEMAGQSSQYYSLRTGGHYKIYYGSPDGIRQLHYSMNHWSMSPDNEPVVNSILIPLIKDQYECLAELHVEKNWQINIANAIALAPLLQSPRTDSTFSIDLKDVLRSEISDLTFHVCWRKDRHVSFVASLQEPRFTVSDDRFERLPYEGATLEWVSDLLSDP